MNSSGTVARCEFRGRIMSLSRPNPGRRKLRNDRRFCNDACRQAHHRSRKKHQDRGLEGVVRHSFPVLAEGFEVEQREHSKAGIVERLSARRPGLDRDYAG